MTNKPSGYLLHETATYVVIATGLTRNRNPKTGDMIQVWILPREVSPVQAVQTGVDDVVCFDCVHRGTVEVGPMGERVVNRTCYVKVFQAPFSVWKAYVRGKYPVLAIEDFKYVFAGRKIRFGAYGEPVLIPLAIMAELARVSDGWTGYTHQWAHLEYAQYKAYLMASCDSVGDYIAAKSEGWRTFRVRTSTAAPMFRNEIVCPASDEGGHKSTCENCRLCSGATFGDPRKDIAIVVHGSGASKFVQLVAEVK